MKPRPDLLDDRSPEGLEVVQLTAAPEVRCSHVYMEAQVFTPDSRRLVLHRAATAHDWDPCDPQRGFVLCDLDDEGALTPLTVETGVAAPSVSPDGAWLYYLVDETEPGAGRLTLKRVRLDAAGRETLAVIDWPVHGSPCRPSQPYCLSTISSDGRRLATAAFFGDGTMEPAPFGLLVFDLETGGTWVPLIGPTWCNLHPQYSRSLLAPANHDILVQENHGCKCDALGNIARLVGGNGADIHLIRDDGSDFRSMPWGRDGNEQCQGHQCWRGRDERAITSTDTGQPREARLVQGTAAPDAGHIGIGTPGGTRDDLSRLFPTPRFCHFATDISGSRLITDYRDSDGLDAIYVADLPEPDDAHAPDFRYLLRPRCTWTNGNHAHPFLSPDGRAGFLTSDETGVSQSYMVRGW